jgi:type II secretory pathway pseudopilin PulG
VTKNCLEIEYMNRKLKSFTLAELLVVMIITAIVVGIAFSVLRLVQKQIHTIQKNYEKSTILSLFEQRIWQDFNEIHEIEFDGKNNVVTLKSEMDTVVYVFDEQYILRNNDTIKLKLTIDKTLFEGKQVKEGSIDGMLFSGKAELPNYTIFVSKKNDLTYLMNQEDGI